VNKIVNRDGSKLYPYTSSLIFHCPLKQPVFTSQPVFIVIQSLAITCHDEGGTTNAKFSHFSTHQLHHPVENSARVQLGQVTRQQGVVTTNTSVEPFATGIKVFDR